MIVVYHVDLVFYLNDLLKGNRVFVVLGGFGMHKDFKSIR